MPVWFHAVRHVGPWELLSQRIVWSALLLVVVLSLVRRWKTFAASLASPRTRRTLVITACLIAVNWSLYITAAVTQQIVQGSLGYFIAPLMNTALGVLVLGERLRPLQKAAIALAIVGVVVFAILSRAIPGLALGLAVSFSIYGLLRKTAAADALVGLTAESLALAPLALAHIVWLQVNSTAAFGRMDRSTDLLLVAGSVMTVTPLFCFAQAARRLRLTTMGFLQFLSPSIQLVIAVGFLGEAFRTAQVYGFGFIWLALLIYTWDAVRQKRAAPRTP